VNARSKRWLTLLLAVATALFLVYSSPAALRDAWERGGIYLFSQECLDDLPRRLTGPGKLRFVVQPSVAILLGIAAGRRDARAGHPPYLYALVLGKLPRAELLRSAARDIVHVVLLGILLDAIAQRIMFGVVHPVVALLVGPVLITLPYAAARALANRVFSARNPPRGS
jgi:hypothetical protein